MDALYAFTDCEISLSPNTCVIIDDKPRFVGVEDVLRQSTKATVRLLERELEIRQEELWEKWHNASLEKIFIENRIYRKIEECETWAEILETIDKGLKKFVRIAGEKARADDQRIVLRRPIRGGRPHAPYRNPHQAHLEVRRLQGRRVHCSAWKPSWPKWPTTWPTSPATPSTTSRAC